jgi:ammonia channel protein AmtB
MWLIHVGFMAYEGGASRRKNLMSTAMKNILTIAVVTPTFYYAGWYIYGCFEQGLPWIGPDSLDGHAGPEQFPGFCGQTAPWAEEMGPNLANHLNAVFFLAFLLFSWTTGSIRGSGSTRRTASRVASAGTTRT